MTVASRVAVLAVAVLLAGCGGAKREGQKVTFSDSTPEADAKPREARKARVTDEIRVGSRPHGITVGGGAVWVVTSGDGKLVRIDPATAKVRGSIGAGERPGEVAVAGGQVYVTSQGTGEVLRFAVGSDASDVVATAANPEGLAASRAGAWVVSTGPGRLTRVGGASVPTGGDEPVTARLGDNGLWVTDARADTVTVFDAGTLERTAGPLDVGANPRDVLEAFGSAWVVATDRDRVQRVDTRSYAVAEGIRVGDEPHHIAAGAGSLWVANAAAGTVSRIDPRSSKVVDTVRTGGRPLSIAFGAGAVWVSDFGSDVVFRISP